MSTFEQIKFDFLVDPVSKYAIRDGFFIATYSKKREREREKKMIITENDKINRYFPYKNPSKIPSLKINESS
jgi:hypothetical protein